jgi:exopolysaccharide/PEP-CTERM locus tyrosine autokinase
VKFFETSRQWLKGLKQTGDPGTDPTLPQPLALEPLNYEFQFGPGASPGVEGIDYTATRTLPVELNTLVRHRLIAGSADPQVVEAYKLLRTQILQKTLEERRNVLMVTSPRPDEGKTLTVVNLAISLAQEISHTVLLVDADLRAPGLHQYFGLPEGPGLVDYLEGNKSIPELLVHPRGLDKLVLLPGGRPTDWAAELIRSARMAQLVQELKNFYPDRYVLFDLPPCLSYADALAFAPLVDGIVLVVEARKTPREDLLRLKEMLAKFPVLGYVFNKVDHLNDQKYYREYYRRNGNSRRGLRWLKECGKQK